MSYIFFHFPILYDIRQENVENVNYGRILDLCAPEYQNLISLISQYFK